MAGRDRSVSHTYALLRKWSTRESDRATHVALDGGMWQVQDWNSFWEACSQDIFEGKLFPICEMRSDEFPMFFDFDAKVPNTVQKPDDFILTLVRTINKQIPKFFKDEIDPKILETYILTCERKLDNENKMKYGFHIHWPNLIVNQYNAFLIRMSAIAGCRTLVKAGNFYSYIDMEEAFDVAPFKNSRGSLRLLGAPKPKLCTECNNVTKNKKNCNMCIRSGYLTPDPYTYKLDMILQDQERAPELESQMKNISRLLKVLCIHTSGRQLTEGFEKYMECPEPDIFIHNPKKEPTLLNVAKNEEKLLPKGVKNEVVTDSYKIEALQNILPKFGQSMVPNPYESTTIRRTVYGPMYSKDPKDKGKMQYTVNLQDEGSNFCPFKRTNHRGNHIFMRVCEGYSGNGFAQLKCYDEKCQGLTFGMKHLSPEQMKILFSDKGLPDQKMLMKLVNPKDDLSDADNLFHMMKNAKKQKK